MWKEAPVSGLSARTSILDKGGVLMVLYLLLLSESWKVGPEKCALYIYAEAPVSSSSARMLIVD